MIHNSQTPHMYYIYLFSLGLEGFFVIPRNTLLLYVLSLQCIFKTRPLFLNVFWNAFLSSNTF